MQPAGPPIDVVVPEAVRLLAAGRRLTPVWQNELGGLTFQVGSGPERSFVKWAAKGSGLDLMAEQERLNWAIAHTAVPRVLGSGVDSDGAWLLTEGLPGDSAVSPRWLQHPEVAVRAAGHGLRRLHEALPVDVCPFSWSVENRLENARERGSSPDGFPSAPAVDRLVVCHGDPCVPNTLVDDAGQWAGHVDMASLGVADRWADLAVGSWSTEWNYGPGWQAAYFTAYGVEPDAERIAFYRFLWDL
jgi:kanamycin kinase